MTDSNEPDPVGAIGRAATRAAYHLLRAGVETLKAVQAVVDELGRMNDPAPPPERRGRVRIDLE